MKHVVKLLDKSVLMLLRLTAAANNFNNFE